MSRRLQFRKGHRGDEQWLFELFRTTMHEYIDKAWGWEELLQREGFVTSLPAREFQILEVNGRAVASYHLSSRADHLLLDIIMVEPEWQRQGLGRIMMEQIQALALERRLPIRLSVLQTNPAVAFHRHLGFIENNRDKHSLQMQWQPAA